MHSLAAWTQYGQGSTFDVFYLDLAFSVALASFSESLLCQSQLNICIRIQ